MTYYRLLETPIGQLRLVANRTHLTAIEFEGQHGSGGSADAGIAPLDAAAQQLGEYFAGDREDFALPLAPGGTKFQQTVWRALVAIPFGEVRSYRDIAGAIGRDRAVRAVGAANGRNPLPVVVPCHRVIGSSGRLTGFAGGLAAKEWLLRFEGAWPT